MYNRMSETTSKIATTSQKQNTMTPSSEQFLNPIERVVGEIAAAQEIIKQKKLLIMGLKLEIDQHHQENNFKDGDIIEGMRVEKITRSNGYEYKPAIINKINSIKRKAEEDGDVIAKPPTEYWRVGLV